MDIVTDLTSHAVSYLIVYQDLVKNKLTRQEDAAKHKNFYAAKLKRIQEIYMDDEPAVRKKLSNDEQTAADAKLFNGFVTRAEKLYACITSHFENVQKNTDFKEGEIRLTGEYEITSKIIMLPDSNDVNLAPINWRTKIRALMFEKVENRLYLSHLLNYVPVQILLALGGNKIDNLERAYQTWNYDSAESSKFTSRFTDTDYPIKLWWKKPAKIPGYDVKALNKQKLARILLVNDELLVQFLKIQEVALPFDSFLGAELSEIRKRRDAGEAPVRSDINLPDTEPATPAADSKPAVQQLKGLSDDNNIYSIPKKKANDPFIDASAMQLAGLALSGGGIRSATFSLGVLQKLAELDTLKHFDYISTVSGGGYIGSWFISWIKRLGSLSAATVRLDPTKSKDPLADEVRPIRWLRMYSNYLSPNASIMSADAWTTGMTWLRNTLINQTILLLLLLTVLSGISFFFNLWRIVKESSHNFTLLRIFLWSVVALGPAALLAGMGMKNRLKTAASTGKHLSGNQIAARLIIWGVFVGFFVSAWLFGGLRQIYSYRSAITLLFPVGVTGCLCLLFVAIVGKYFSQAAGYTSSKVPGGILIFVSSVLAAAIGLAALANVWIIFSVLPESWLKLNDFREKQIFILGTPLILEAVSITVVVRMALMGLLFPDEKREWWGRLGGIMHRFALLWILVSFGALLLPELLKQNFGDIPKWISPTAGATWATLVAAGVKMGFKSATQVKPADSGSSKAADLFVRIAPYLFMIGFLLIGAYTLEAVINAFEINHLNNPYILLGRFAFMAGVLSAITLFISWRTGVNEFSLHHFYRNRLTRAYLGATRRRDDRDSTADEFTGFDNNDDIKVADFRFEKGYYGPYPILNTALNATDATELDRQDRMAESFIFSPMYCGYDFSATRSALNNRSGLFNYGYRDTASYAAPGGPWLGSVVATSGAAVSPNMGYHSSPATAFLLTMFNVRLGRWIGNPRSAGWQNSEPTLGLIYLVYDLLGRTDINNEYVYLSDGGHFDNMGIYELIRRRCHVIVLVDGEQDDNGTCEGLANAIRRCRIDFGVEIDIKVGDIVKKDKDNGLSKAHSVKGSIKYPDGRTGQLIYIKTALTAGVTTDIREYQMVNPKFPQESTGDQFFNEAQFESYRKLGYQSVDSTLL